MRRLRRDSYAQEVYAFGAALGILLGKVQIAEGVDWPQGQAGGGSMIYAGIDIGITGAIAAIKGEGEILELWDMPCQIIRGGKRLRRQVDCGVLADYIDKLIGHGGATVAIEKQGSRPGERATAAHSLGRSYGVIEQALASARIDYRIVTPQTWQHTTGVIKGSGKMGSLTRARELYPTCDQLSRKKDHGRADALLIAEYCRRVSV